MHVGSTGKDDGRRHWGGSLRQRSLRPSHATAEFADILQLTDEQMQALILRTADLAALHGQTLPDAMDKVMRGLLGPDAGDDTLWAS